MVRKLIKAVWLMLAIASTVLYNIVEYDSTPYVDSDTIKLLEAIDLVSCMHATFIVLAN